MRARVLWTLAVWAFAGLTGLAFVRESMIGPTVWALDAYHGVHLGDLVAGAAFPAYAAWVTWALWRRTPAG